MNTALKFGLLVLAITLIATSGASAEILAYDGFATNADGSGIYYQEGVLLAGYDGPPSYEGVARNRLGFEEASHWYAYSASMSVNVNASAQTGSLNYAGFLTIDDGHAQPQRTGGIAGPGKFGNRALDYALPGGFTEYYVAALIDYNNAGGGFGFGGASGRNNLFTVDSDGTLLFEASGSSATDYNGSFSTGGTHLVVIRYRDSMTGYYDNWDIWIDPDVSGGALPETPDGTGVGIGINYTGGAALPNVNAFIGANQIASGQHAMIDEFYIATEQSDFLVPEPTTLGLLGLGAVALLRKKRV